MTALVELKVQDRVIINSKVMPLYTDLIGKTGTIQGIKKHITGDTFYHVHLEGVGFCMFIRKEMRKIG